MSQDGRTGTGPGPRAAAERTQLGACAPWLGRRVKWGEFRNLSVGRCAGDREKIGLGNPRVNVKRDGI